MTEIKYNSGLNKLNVTFFLSCNNYYTIKSSDFQSSNDGKSFM